MATTTKSRRIKAKPSPKAANQGAKDNYALSVQKQNQLFKLYNTPASAFDLSKQVFRIEGFRRKDQTKLDLTGYTTQLQWEDLSGQLWLSGNITLNQVTTDRGPHKLAHGDVIRNSVFWLGRWVHLWDMRIWDPDDTIQTGFSQVQADIYDDLWLLSKSTGDFHYTNMYCHEILTHIAHDYQIPLGKVAKGIYKIPVFDHQDTAPTDAIIDAYQQEHSHTQRRFVMRWQNNGFNVVPFTRNPLMFVMHGQLQNVTAHHITPDDFATRLVLSSSVQDAFPAATGGVAGTVDTNKTRKVAKHKAYVEHNVDQWGLIVAKAKPPSHFNERDLQTWGKHDLARRQRIGHDVDFEHRGIALLRKGDACQVLVPEGGLSGGKSVVWVVDLTHSLQSSGYTMTPKVTAIDPFVDDDRRQRDLDLARREARRVERKRALQESERG